jgi:phenylalanyl-tRNA synthetase beta chain
VGILERLGFGVEGSGVLTVKVPGWRNDVEQAVDLYEEVMRIYGYDRVPMNGKLQATLGTFEGMKLRKSENALRQYLCDQGLLEAATNSLHPAAWYPGKERYGCDACVIDSGFVAICGLQHQPQG